MRLVATDLDGTIVPSSGVISDRVRSAIAACRAVGVPVVYVTGRPVRWLGPIVDQVGHDGWAICANGAAVLDLASEEVHAQGILTIEQVTAIVEHLRRQLPNVTFGVETLAGFRAEQETIERFAKEKPKGALVGRFIEDLLSPDAAVLKLLVVNQSTSSDELLAIARAELADQGSPTHSAASFGAIEIAPLGVSKGVTLAALARQLGVNSSDVVAFGDMPNDVDMLTWAGRGYAMSNGHPEALAATPWRAEPIDHDGVALVLEELLASGGTFAAGTSAQGRAERDAVG